MSQFAPGGTSDDSSVDHQLESLLSRIRSLTGEKSTPSSEHRAPPLTPPTDAADAPVPDAPAQTGLPGPVRRQPRPAPGATPVARSPMDLLTGAPLKRSGGPRLSTDLPNPRPAAAKGDGGPGDPETSPPPEASRENPSAEPVAASRPRRPVAETPGFEPSRDEPWRPPEPEDLRDGGVNETLLEAIIYRFLLNIGECEGRKIADQVKLPFRLIEPLLTRLKMEQNVAYKGSTTTNDYVYILTETGRAIARNHISDCSYYGSCPVPLDDYITSVGLQTIEGQYPKKTDLQQAFADLLIDPHMLDRLGPAVASGRGMFLYGFPGNGKTSIAERVTGAFGKYLWVPRAIDVDGEILRVFDPMSHRLAMPESNGGLLDAIHFDKRWVRIERPTIVAGGELTLDMLEVLNNAESNINESPLQLKSNCGTLVIDDFGRQKMSVDQLLNRWIVPLEKRYDFLNMPSGKKIQVPFDQLVIFSTNLEPRDLVDDAFLRRIPYKIEVGNPPESDFRRLFEIMCGVMKIPYNPEAIDYLIRTHYLPVDRPFRNCQPRDLLLQVKNYCLYNDREVELKPEYFDFACENYFSVM